MITLSGRLVCASAAEADLVRTHLPEHLRLTLAEPGCLSFAVVATDNPLVWQVEESFIDRPAFEAHQSRSRASAWYAVTAPIRRDYRISGL
jgi:quinol monooxygenase YgiN